MRINSIRRTGAFVIILTVWFSAVAFYPISIAAQAPASKKQENKGKKEKGVKKPEPAQTAGPRVLSEKEDPSQIGKRKINSGSDKLFGWLGGSQDREVALGRQLALQVEQQAKLIEDPIVTEYVNRVGQNVVLHSDAKVPFTIKVIDSDEVNAFALPGGFFFVNKGLILAADNEAELAGVMAHEIAHVAARHAMENHGKGTLINYSAIAGIIFGGPIVSGIIQNAGGILSGLASLKFSRGAELEADSLGVQYLYASGYDPTSMSTMFEKLASRNKKKPGSLTKLFSSHPQSVDRRDGSLALVARFAEREEYVISTSEFQRVKSHLLKITNAKAGISSDFDEAENGKPTLKRRQPDPVDGDSGDSGKSSNSSSSEPPKLKKRGEPEPEATPKP
ncbi:MAG: M48 family metallopeptidase [Pyrinomonadaceae bacterium]|nr:M48 family metalloprotease [Blastocatellia bacterium]MDQ3491309.1 M48 family metallopeptidase [Acidobacteriota bacterium]